jgi:hypothetical protein
MDNQIVTTRSHYQTFLNSKRLYYITYQYRSNESMKNHDPRKRGIVPLKVPVALQIGTYIHAVAGNVMSGGSEAEAHKEQTDIWNKLRSERGFDTPFDPDDLLALAQGLSMSWVRNRWKELEKQYEVLAVEKERELKLTESAEQFTVRFPMRLDAEVRDKFTGTFHGIEIKSTGSTSPHFFNRFTYDIQTLCHHWCVSQTYGSCHSILMEYCLKGYGSRDFSKWNSPLTKGWEKLGSPPMDKHMYECAYARARTKDWNEIRVSQRFSQEEWYKLLGKKLDNTVSSGAITRSDLELPEFQLQFFFAHKRINEGIHLLNSCQTKTEEKKLLATYFPMSYHQFDSHLINFDPEEALESGEYIFREPHHPLEKEYMESSIQ